jgi:hypothetical protein
MEGTAQCGQLISSNEYLAPKQAQIDDEPSAHGVACITKASVSERF